MQKLPNTLSALGMATLMATFACAGPDPRPRRGAEETTYTKLDDMEGSQSFIEWRPDAAVRETTPGFWSSYTEGQCEALYPVPPYEAGDMGDWSHATLPEPHETFPGVVSTQAARLRTVEPLVNVWGAGLGFYLALDTELPLSGPEPCTPEGNRRFDFATPAVSTDFSRFRGITFFAMAAEDQDTTTIRVSLSDANTDPHGGICDLAVGTPTECYNNWGIEIELDAVPTRYTVDFSELAQAPNWGYRSDAPDLEQVYAVNFDVPTPGGTCPPPRMCAGGLPSLTFDVWIDDVHLVNE